MRKKDEWVSFFHFLKFFLDNLLGYLNASSGDVVFSIHLDVGCLSCLVDSSFLGASLSHIQNFLVSSTLSRMMLRHVASKCSAHSEPHPTDSTSIVIVAFILNVFLESKVQEVFEVGSDSVPLLLSLSASSNVLFSELNKVGKDRCSGDINIGILIDHSSHWGLDALIHLSQAFSSFNFFIPFLCDSISISGYRGCIFSLHFFLCGTQRWSDLRMGTWFGNHSETWTGLLRSVFSCVHTQVFLERCRWRWRMAIFVFDMVGLGKWVQDHWLVFISESQMITRWVSIVTRDSSLLMIEIVGTHIILHEVLAIMQWVLHLLQDDDLLHIEEYLTLVDSLHVSHSWLWLRRWRQDAFLELRVVRRDFGFFISLGNFLILWFLMCFWRGTDLGLRVMQIVFAYRITEAVKELVFVVRFRLLDLLGGGFALLACG